MVATFLGMEEEKGVPRFRCDEGLSSTLTLGALTEFKRNALRSISQDGFLKTARLVVLKLSGRL